MSNRPNRTLKYLLPKWGRWPASIAGALVLLTAVISCRTSRTVVVLPQVPGAKYVGSKACDECHSELYKTFQTADHARLLAKGTNALNAGCESCHGPGSLHAESGGEVKPPYSFTSGRPLGAGFAGRLPLEPARATETVCFNCHAEVRGQFNLSSHHPVPEGRMSCVQCHPPHKGLAFAGGSTLLRSREETCLQCHPAQRGPYVFEHEAMREGCTACHTPHGSVNAKMLTERNANLCFKCHFQQVKSDGAIFIGGKNHTDSIRQGACWNATCHEAVHGSRVSSSLRF